MVEYFKYYDLFIKVDHKGKYYMFIDKIKSNVKYKEMNINQALILSDILNGLEYERKEGK